MEKRDREGKQQRIALLSEGTSEHSSRLTPRQRAIILLLVRVFVRSARPVSSGRLSDEFDISSATIRNELTMLEELGFVSKDHQASGRVPTDLAYRYFVDEVRDQFRPDPDEQARTEVALSGLERELAELIRGTLHHLSKETGQAAWMSVPVLPDLSINSIDFIPTAERSFLILLVTTKGNTKHRMATLDQRIEPSLLIYLKEQLNNYLSGKSVQDIDLGEVARIFRDVSRLPKAVIEHVTGFLSEMGHGIERIFIGDPRPLFAQPEFRDAGLINAVLEVLNDQLSFHTYVRDILGDQDMQVVIGQENKDGKLSACSLVLSKYYLEDKVSGTVGVIGPTRQTYDLNIPVVAIVAECLTELFKETPFSL